VLLNVVHQGIAALCSKLPMKNQLEFLSELHEMEPENLPNLLLLDQISDPHNVGAIIRSAIAFVPQDTALFHRTLYENILYAKPSATKNDILSASISAHAHDFIQQYPNTYDTLVGERGVKLSGGQRQRIALARAMLKNAPILVLDEATSALDSESEEVIQKGLEELFKKRTVLAIAHRLSTLRAMDRIIVLEEGQIVEDGNPQELLEKKDGLFKHMWEHQKKGFI
jgi:ABC-type multidrug transport system fused ATPase/permease subunit